MSTLHSIWTVFVFVFFLAIVKWAWSDRQKQAFDAASRIPLEDDIAPAGETGGEKNNG